MDVRIGVMRAKELDIELADDVDRDELATSIESQLADGKVLWLTDRKGRRVGVPSSKLAYIEIGADAAQHRVGFSAL